MSTPDPILLEIIKSQLTAVADEMGAALGRTGYSPNIKERRDYSCAVFDAAGDMVAQAAHIPVHLGAMPLSVRASLDRFGSLADGDIVVLNDPYAGGSHLPDITMVSPVFAVHPHPSSIPPSTEQKPPLDVGGRLEGGERFEERLLGYVASRAHHADVGGMSPGSMPLARELFQEGLIIPPVLLQQRGEINQAVLDLISRNSRTPGERLGDLSAQIAAQRVGERRLQALAQRHGSEEVAIYMAHLQDYAERMVRELIRQMPLGQYIFEDYLDDDGFGHSNLAIRVKITVGDGQLVVDFSETAPQTEGGVNAVRAVTLSAVFYVIRCLLDDDLVPTNAGIFRPVLLITPDGSLSQCPFSGGGGCGQCRNFAADHRCVAGSLCPGDARSCARRLARHDE